MNPSTAYRRALGVAGISKFDTDALASWEKFCDDAGLRFDFPENLSGMTVYDVLKLIAAAGDALAFVDNGKWSVRWNEPALA